MYNGMVDVFARKTRFSDWIMHGLAARSHANSSFEKVHLIGQEKMEIYVDSWNVVGFPQML